MPIVKAALLPHSPLLIPEIGKSNYNLLQKTQTAYQEILDGCKQQAVDTLIILSPHGLIQENTFTINAAPEFSLNLGQFGFLNNKKIKGDIVLSYNLKQKLKSDFPIQQITINPTDYGSAIPLYLFQTQIPKLKTIIIYHSGLDLETHRRFGIMLGQFLHEQKDRIAIIASGDLSHRLKKSSPAGYSPKGAKFDNKIIEYLNDAQNGSQNLLNIDSNLSKDAGECGLKAIVTLSGVLENFKHEAKVLAYQTDFGIGYLSMDFLLK